MKKLFLLTVLCCSINLLQAQLFVEPFTYSDGDLASTANWNIHSGAGGTDIAVLSNEVVLSHGAGSREDLNRSFTEQTAGSVFCTMDVSVNDNAPISGSDSEYFLHFNTSSFVGRVDVVPASSGGDFSFGIATSSSTANATWATDLTFGTTYTLVLEYNIDENVAKLWINPTSESSTSISGEDLSGTGNGVSTISLRQSNSSSDETITIDDMTLSTVFPTGLPVEFVSFNAKVLKEQVALSWQTASEENNSHFEVEHSTNGRDFQTLDKVIGNGTTAEIQQYNYIHEDAANGKNYYRLRQVDFDGAFEYSDVAVVEIKGEGEVQIRPTLANENVTLAFGETTRQETQVQIIDIAGRKVMATSIASGTDQMDLSVATLEKGLYFVQLALNGELTTLKFVKQ